MKNQANVGAWEETSWSGVCDEQAKLAKPTLVITGTDDNGYMPHGNALILAGKIPGAWLVQIKVEPRIKELFLGHSIGLDDHYFKPGENYVLQEYLKAVDNLTINEENRLRKEIVELGRKNGELEIMELKHREEIRAIREDMESKFQQIVTKIDIAKVQ